MNGVLAHLIERLNKEERRKNYPYVDCCGKSWRSCICEVKGYLTIGKGRNLDVRGISNDEMDLLCENDVLAAQIDLYGKMPWTKGMDGPRLEVLLDMTFNLG